MSDLEEIDKLTKVKEEEIKVVRTKLLKLYQEHAALCERAVNIICGEDDE